MTPQETNALLDAAARIDSLILNTDETFEVWQFALGGVDYQQAAHVMKAYYAMQEVGARNPITPGYIRRTASRESERAAAKRAAIEARPAKPVSVSSWRSRNPAEWDRLKTQGAVDRLEDMERRGEIGDDQWRLDEFRASGILPPAGKPRADEWA